MNEVMNHSLQSSDIGFDCLSEVNLVLKDISSKSIIEKNNKSLVWDATVFPTKSHYFPIMLNLIKKLMVKGKINPEEHVLIETTTGNAGSSCAYVAKLFGFDVIIFMPEDMPKARIDDVKNNMPKGEMSKIIFTESNLYVKGMVDHFRDFYHKNKRSYHGKKLYPLNHSQQKDAVEVIDQLMNRLILKNEVLSNIDYGIVALGNGTTASGTALAIKRLNPNAQIHAVEPVECPRFYVEKYGIENYVKEFGKEPNFGPHGLLGTGGWGVDFPHIDLSLIDEIHLISKDVWQNKQKELCDNGFFYGNSTAACQAVAEEISKKDIKQSLTILGMAYDPISKY